jgi:elongation factor P
MNIPIRRGMVVRHQNHVLVVDDFHERHSGKQKPVVHVDLHDVVDGHHVDRTLDELLPVSEVEHSYRRLQYLYHKPGEAGGRGGGAAGTFVFMDNNTFDEFELGGAELGTFEPFLSEGQEFRVMFVEDRPVRLELPEIVSLHVTETSTPERGMGSAGSVMKEATLENGLVVKVPLFIKQGDLIRVETRSRAYAGKEKEQHA